METVTPYIKKYSPFIIAILYSGYASYSGMDKNVLFQVLVAMVLVYITTVQFADTKTRDKLHADIRILQKENDGLKQNLMKVYSMVQQRTNPPQTQHTQRSPQPASSPMAQTDTSVAPKAAGDQDDPGKPYT
jgi:hypothetical protein